MSIPGFSLRDKRVKIKFVSLREDDSKFLKDLEALFFKKIPGW